MSTEGHPRFWGLWVENADYPTLYRDLRSAKEAAKQAAKLKVGFRVVLFELCVVGTILAPFHPIATGEMEE